MSFIAGRFTGTYASNALGQTADGFRLSFSFFKRLITGDAYAETPQDGIHRGGEMFLAANLIEYNAAGAQGAFWPASATIFSLGTIGVLDVGGSLVKALVLTAIAGTSAATVPATLTLTNAVLAEGFPVELLYAPDLREVPLRFRIYPNSGVFGTQT